MEFTKQLPENCIASILSALCITSASFSSLANTSTYLPENHAALQHIDCVVEPSEVIDVGSAVSGLLEAVYVNRSEGVAKGAVLAKLESAVEERTVQLTQSRAKSMTAIKMRQTGAAFEERNKKRNRALVESNSISAQDMDQIKTESELAKLQLSQERENKHLAGLEYERAKAALARRLIVSPVTGVVMERFKAVGEFVDEQPILRVARLNPLHVEAILPTRFLPSVGVGMTAGVTLDLLGGTSHKAKIIRVDRVADAASGTFGIQLSLKNDDYRIPAGVRCQLSLDTKTIERSAIDTTAELIAGAENKLPGSNTISEPAKIMALAVRNADVFYSSTKLPINKTEDQLLPRSKELLVSSPELFFTSSDKPDGDNKVSIPTNSVTAATQCFRIGPVASLEEYEELNDVFGSQYGEKTQSTIADYPGQTYLVMTPILDEPGMVTAKLQESKINDFYLMRSGVYKNRVSLGFYKQKPSAARRKSALDALGIESEILPRNPVKYWLDIRSSATPELNNNHYLVERSQSLGFPVQWLKQECQ